MALTPRLLMDACWRGYVQAGTKRKGGRRVPNCIPASSGLAKPRPQADTEEATDAEGSDGKKYTKTVTNPETGRKNKVRYGAKGYTIAPGTDKGDRYCARSFGDMKSHGKDCSGPDRNTPLCLSRTKWRCSGKTSRRDAPETGNGQPCGFSYIPKNHKCKHKTTNINRVALTAGLISGAAVVGLTAATLNRRNRIAQSNRTSTTSTNSAHNTNSLFNFAPKHKNQLAKLSPKTQQELLAYHKTTPLTVLTVDTDNDFVIAKYNKGNEYIGLSSVGDKVIDVSSEGYNDGYIVTFRVNKSLTRQSGENVTTTRNIINRVRRITIEQAKQMPPHTILYAEPIDADGSQRGRTSLYARLGFRDTGDPYALTATAQEIINYKPMKNTRRDAPEPVLDGRSTDYYRNHPEAAAKKVRHQAAINRRPEERERRASLNRERRRRGIAGKGGPDISHTSSGRTVLEDPSTNRGRNGHGKQPRLKRDSIWADGFAPETATTLP